MTIEPFGFSQIFDNLDKYSRTMQADIQTIFEVAGEVGLQLMDDFCPVDTGYLKSRNQVTVGLGQLTLSNDADYAAPVELGHHTQSGSFVAPQPWIVPAFVTTEDFIKSELARLGR